MQLRSRRAGINFEKGQIKEAAEELKELIVLNPNDNQGLRILLSSWLMIQHNWSGLADLLALYVDEMSLPMLAAKALMLYAQEGDSTKANKAKKAKKVITCKTNEFYRALMNKLLEFFIVKKNKPEPFVYEKLR
jgi:predicted Zn-dependent protease